jgi:transposase
LFWEPYQSNLFMYCVLSKDIIASEIICHLPIRKRRFKPQAPTCEIINCILYKLKMGIQRHLLPVESLFSTHFLHYKTVFGHYRRWYKEGVWQKCWI